MNGSAILMNAPRLRLPTRFGGRARWFERGLLLGERLRNAVRPPEGETCGDQRREVPLLGELQRIDDKNANGLTNRVWRMGTARSDQPIANAVACCSGTVKRKRSSSGWISGVSINHGNAPHREADRCSSTARSGQRHRENSYLLHCRTNERSARSGSDVLPLVQARFNRSTSTKEPK